MENIFNTRESIYSLNSKRLSNWLKNNSFPTYRNNQIFQWLYKQSASSFDEMNNLPKDLREALSQSFELFIPTSVIQQKDQHDGSIKHLFELHDRERIEAVLMPQFDKETKTDPKSGAVTKSKAQQENQSSQDYTACLTTQVGCMFACRFCASGQLGLKRNMQAGEIVSQILALKQEKKEISRIVFMGTGEPLHNLDEMQKCIEVLCSKDGFNYSPRRITVSTVGLVPEIYQIAKDGWKVKLAVSLHATTNEKRKQLMPLGRAYDLDQLKDSLIFINVQMEDE
jgi:23S rRNA (adenine2503-C2)-methyltransferase